MVSGRKSRQTRQGKPAGTSAIKEGWPQARVFERHLRYAQALVDDGFEFRPMDTSEDETVTGLIRATVPGAGSFTFDTHSGGIVALTSDQSIAGALVTGAVQFAEGPAAILRYLAVEPDWRGHGIGVVLLGILPQLFTDQPLVLTFGNCAPTEATYYQRGGFTVLPPGLPLPMPVGNHALLANTSQHQPCWFYRGW